ncbi:MAG: hypothetical protein PHD09_01205 [Candidatus Omnitrophica bacterium]|nr:hypothetical protein [Candidatus Omnitrophota bacterium]
MNTQEVIKIATKHLTSMQGHAFDVLSVSKPISPDAAVNLSKVVSKLSPILGNLIEFNTVEYLNDQKEFTPYGKWLRQDPGFPDAIFQGSITPTPGFEIKAWFPLATEITARFKDSQNHFINDQTHVALLAWLPEQLIFGKPIILDVCVVSGKSVAVARDTHYHNPPDYLVLEPEDTSSRTRNLQQTNTNGYKWQGTSEQFNKAKKIVASWGSDAKKYAPTPAYQTRLRELISRFPYRLDTNFAKMDRIVHSGIEDFKIKVLGINFQGKTVGEWSKILCSDDLSMIKRELESRFKIKEEDSREIIK